MAEEGGGEDDLVLLLCAHSLSTYCEPAGCCVLRQSIFGSSIWWEPDLSTDDHRLVIHVGQRKH